MILTGRSWIKSVANWQLPLSRCPCPIQNNKSYENADSRIAVSKSNA